MGAVFGLVEPNECVPLSKMVVKWKSIFWSEVKLTS